MKKVPLLCDGKTIGELTVTQEGEDTLFSARCKIPQQALWCIWAIGRDNVLRIGCPEVKDGEAQLTRRFSGRMTNALGPILRGELRRSQRTPQVWEQGTEPSRFFRTEELCRLLRVSGGFLTRRKGTVRLVAIPFSGQRPFPLVSMFCFARIERFQNGIYAVFAFNEKEQPVFQTLENL